MHGRPGRCTARPAARRAGQLASGAGRFGRRDVGSPSGARQPVGGLTGLPPGSRVEGSASVARSYARRFVRARPQQGGISSRTTATGSSGGYRTGTTRAASPLPSAATRRGTRRGREAPAALRCGGCRHPAAPYSPQHREPRGSHRRDLGRLDARSRTDTARSGARAPREPCRALPACPRERSSVGERDLLRSRPGARADPAPRSRLDRGSAYGSWLRRTDEHTGSGPLPPRRFPLHRARPDVTAGALARGGPEVGFPRRHVPWPYVVPPPSQCRNASRSGF